MKDALDRRRKQTIDSNIPVLRWLARHAASMVAKCNVEQNGRTSCERWEGKLQKVEQAEFGECVHFRE